MVLEGLTQILRDISFVEIILPFILVFLLVYALSKHIPHLGQNNKLRGLLAFLLGASVIIPQVTNQGTNVVPVILQSIPIISLVIVITIGVLMVLGGTGNDGVVKAGWLKWAALIVVIFIFISTVLAPQSTQFTFGNEDIQKILMFLLIFGVITWFIMKK